MRLSIIVGSTLAVVALAFAPIQAEVSYPQVWVNEFHYDNSSTDDDEFVEIAINAGSGGTLPSKLDGWSLVRFNNGAIYTDSIPKNTLSDTAITNLGNGFGLVVIDFPSNGLQNGPNDGFAIVDNANQCVQLLSYEGVLTVSTSAASCAGMTSVDVGVSQNGAPVGESLQLIGTGSQYSDFTWTSAKATTKGALNVEQTFLQPTAVGPTASPNTIPIAPTTTAPMSVPVTSAPVAATITKIHDIQGSGSSSPLVDQIVTVSGIVVGDFQNNDDDNTRNLGGFYVQEEEFDYDNDPKTSEGIFVYGGTVDVNLGDVVTVTGTVSEYFSETQIGKVSSIVVTSSNNPLPTPTKVELLDITSSTLNQDNKFQPDLEAFEGMLVVFPETLQITEQFRLNRFNEIKLVSGERPYQFTQIHSPNGTAFNEYLEALGRRTITYDDGLSVQNAAINLLDGFGPEYNTMTAKRMGDTIVDLTGVLSYQWSGNSASRATWRVRSVVDGFNTFTPSASARLDMPAINGDGLKIASMNVLNFFTTLNRSGAGTSGPSGLSPRGANNEAEYDRQLQKMIVALRELDADIIGLIELENEFGGDQNGDGKYAIKTIVDNLNAVLGNGTYAYVDPLVPYIGGDAITCGFIYRPSKLDLTGSIAILDTSVDPTFLDNRNRPVLAVTFEVNPFFCVTATVNHFKSKGSNCESDGDFDAGDGQGNCNGVRTAAATALANWLSTDPTKTGCENQVILGDLNSYAMEDPIKALQNAGFVNIEHPSAYSYVFDGQIGTLDYMLVNQAMYSKLRDTTVWNINSDEAAALDYNLDYGRDASIFDATNPFRSSDHDPLVAVFSTPQLLFNDNFENGFDVKNRWAVRSFRNLGQYLRLINNPNFAHGGSNSIRMQIGGVRTSLANKGTLAVRGFTAVKLSFWYRFTGPQNSSNRVFSFEYNQFNRRLNRLQWSAPIEYDDDMTSEWKHAIYTIPINRNQLKIRFRFDVDNGSVRDRLWFDDVEIYGIE